MSNKIIPKELLSAYQRWELDSLEGPGSRMQGGKSGDSVSLPTAEQIEQIHQQAQRDGFAIGYQEGRAQAEAESQRLNLLLQNLEDGLRQIDHLLAQDTLALSIEIARQMLRQSLRVRPEMVVPVVREAINTLPHVSQHPHLILHPEDALLVRKYLEADLAHSAWRIIEDIRIERGGCRVETHNSEIDATVATRWKRIVATFGRDDSWLESDANAG